MFPALVLVTLFVLAVHDDAVAMDFRQFYWAAEIVRGGGSPYGWPLTDWGGPYPYPPLPALVAIPLTGLPLEVAGLLVMVLVATAAAGSLYVLGIRDWRCYGVMFLWPPVISGIQTANLSLWFTLALAIIWRFRDRIVPVAATIAVTLAAKWFMWPLVVWLVATRRLLCAALACAMAAALVLLSWATIGFAGLSAYPSMLRRVEEIVGDKTYTAYMLGLDSGLPGPVARAVWLTLGLLLLASFIAIAVLGDERTAFVLAIATVLALTPILWLHYFTLLLVVVAIAQPRLGVAWFVPLGMYVATGHGDPTVIQEAATILSASATVVVSVAAIEGVRTARWRVFTVRRQCAAVGS